MRKKNDAFMNRIQFLDGLRGIAILLVICFHSFSRWPKIVPYGNQYSDFYLFKYGYLGVQLFFLISGFVILMSLEKSKTFIQFIYKRWLRLFPAMLIATILVYSTTQFLQERPSGIPELNAIIPGLFFIEPSWIKTFLSIKINPLEGAFWSLFVEFKFYFIFGISYFLMGKIKAIAIIFMLFIIAIFAEFFQIKYLNTFSHLLSFEYFGWFASGSLAYLYFVNNQSKYILLCVLVSFIEMLKYLHDISALLYIIFILALFITPICFEKTRILFKNKLLLFFGLISYPLYLIHENALISLICKTNQLGLPIPNLLLPILPLFVLCIISYVIVTYFEPFVSKTIQKIVLKLPSKIVLHLIPKT